LFDLGTVVAADVLKHLARVVQAAGGCEVAGTVWEELDAGEEDEGWEVLER
jgi:hypothetical protein